MARFERAAIFDAARVTVTLYVFVFVPFCAVTTVVMVFEPTFNAMAPDAVPEFTAIPFTVTVEVATLVFGVTVIDVMVLATDAV